MASIAPGTNVELELIERAKLRFPPPESTPLVVAVHRLALRAPQNGLTQLVGLANGAIAWAGALDEAMIEAIGAGQDPRSALGRQMLSGLHLWEVFRPGLLTTSGVSVPLLTVYNGERPWVVVGELTTGDVLAAPLNDAAGNPKWFSPIIEAGDLMFPGSKVSQLELAHVWSFGAHVSIGIVSDHGRASVAGGIRSYFS